VDSRAGGCQTTKILIKTTGGKSEFRFLSRSPNECEVNIPIPALNRELDFQVVR